MARFISERKGLFFSNLGLRLIKDLLPFLGPILVGIVVDLLSGSSGRDRTLFGIDLEQNSVRAIVIVAIFMAGLALTKAAVGYIHTIVAAHMGRHVVQAARRDLADAAMQMALDERRRFNSGDLLDRCLADSKGLRGFTQNVIIRVISNTVRAIFPLVFMFMIDPLLALVVLAVIPLQSTFSAMLQRRLQRQTHEARSREAQHTSAVKEAIDGWNNVASVGGQEWAAQGIHDTAAASEAAKIVKKHTTASISVVISVCTSLGIAAVYAIGGWRIISSGVLDGTAEAGALTLGSLTAFIGVAKKTYAPFRAYTKIVSSYRTGLVNLERIADVLDAPMLDPRNDGPELRLQDGAISLDDVSFSYNLGDAPTLRALTGTIPGNSLTVITGSSGAGKTTLLRLLLGLDVPDTGTVAIDGQDINKAKLTSVQSAIALVPQEPVLFTGTLSENLLLGLEDVSTSSLLEACDRAGLIEMVRGLPKGLDTEVGSGKHMLSGGQLRRMAIARALLREPAVLLLDEPTTGLDVQNSSLILNTLRRISDRTTVVMVSHRSEPLKASDHHLILQDGGWTASSDHEGPQPAPSPAPVAGVEAPSAADCPPPVVVSGGAASAAVEAATIGTRPNGAAPTRTFTASAPFLHAVNGSSNGNGRIPAVSLGSHTHIGHRLLAMSAMGRPIVQTGIDSPAATTRVMMISGHRSVSRPITSIGPAVFARVEADEDASIAIGSIEDVNPDGAYSERRETVLGVNLETDHGGCKAAETRILRGALAAWGTSVVIDVAQDRSPMVDGEQLDVVVRFRPDNHQQPAPSDIRFAQELRRRLDLSDHRYRVRMVGSLAGTLAATSPVTVVELTANSPGDAAVIHALIDASVAICHTASTSLLQPN